VIHLEDATVAELLDLPSVTDAVQAALLDLAAGQAATTLRVRAAAGGAMASAMAAVLPAAGVSGGKLYGTYAGGFSFVVGLFATDGGVLCTLDGDVLTRIRTAAATAVAVRHLAPSHATVAALFGTGTQSRWQAQALDQELELAELRVCGRSPGRADELAAWAKEAGLPAQAVDDPGEAIDGAGVVVTVTSSYEPVFPGERLAGNALVCGIGSTKPDRRELDGSAVGRARLVVTDSRGGATVECGDLIQAAAEGLIDLQELVELADVVAGTVARPPTGITLFESQGLALEDVAAAALAYRRWQERAPGALV
jgi:ornithine cyclodeaminase/alanine dehydrogenase-like protein (mu-crystallin family)